MTANGTLFPLLAGLCECLLAGIGYGLRAARGTPVMA
jgi:hypothetical protein